jgi:hypothetical protein
LTWLVEVVWEHEDMTRASRRVARIVGERRAATTGPATSTSAPAAGSAPVTGGTVVEFP